MDEFLVNKERADQGTCADMGALDIAALPIEIRPTSIDSHR